MKKLICAKDIEALGKQGKKVCPVDSDTLITPSAKDAAKACGISFSSVSGNCCESSPAASSACESGIDSELIYTVLKAMMDKGLLKDVIDQAPDQPYVAEKDCGGYKLVRGKTVKLDVFDTGIPENQVYYQELFGVPDKCPMSSGILSFDGKSRFDIDALYDELYYVIDGVVSITVNGKTFTAYGGDQFYIPNGASVTWASPDKAKLFYATFPAIA